MAMPKGMWRLAREVNNTYKKRYPFRENAGNGHSKRKR